MDLSYNEVEVTSRLSVEDVSFALMKKSTGEAVEFLSRIDSQMRDLDFSQELVRRLVQGIYDNVETDEEYEQFIDSLKEV